MVWFIPFASYDSPRYDSLSHVARFPVAIVVSILLRLSRQCVYLVVRTLAWVM